MTKMMANKIDKASSATTKMQQAKISNQCSLLRSIDHLNLPKLAEVHDTGCHIVQIFEKFVGRPINVGKGRRPNGKFVMDTISKGLNLLLYLEKKRITHRNISCQNMLLYINPITQESTLKLVDSCHVESLEASTIIEGPCGTLGYMAPEVINSHPDTHPLEFEQSDMFSLGVVFYELLTWQRAFPGNSEEEVLRKNKNVFIDFKIMDTLFIHDLCQDLVMKMTAPNPEARIRPAEALRHPFFSQENLVFGGSQYEVKESLSMLQEFQNKNKILNSWDTIMKIEERILHARTNFGSFDITEDDNIMELEGTGEGGCLASSFLTIPKKVNIDLSRLRTKKSQYKPSN